MKYLGNKFDPNKAQRGPPASGPSYAQPFTDPNNNDVASKEVFATLASGDLARIQEVLPTYSSGNMQDPTTGDGVLHKAIALSADLVFQEDQLRIVEFLLGPEVGASINLRNNQGETPLFMAAYLNLPDVVERLLEHGADPNIMSNEMRNPLHAMALGRITSCRNKVQHRQLVSFYQKVSPLNEDDYYQSLVKTHVEGVLTNYRVLLGRFMTRLPYYFSHIIPTPFDPLKVVTYDSTNLKLNATGVHPRVERVLSFQLDIMDKSVEHLDDFRRFLKHDAFRTALSPIDNKTTGIFRTRDKKTVVKLLTQSVYRTFTPERNMYIFHAYQWFEYKTRVEDEVTQPFLAEMVDSESAVPSWATNSIANNAKIGLDLLDTIKRRLIYEAYVKIPDTDTAINRSKAVVAIDQLIRTALSQMIDYYTAKAFEVEDEWWPNILDNQKSDADRKAFEDNKYPLPTLPKLHVRVGELGNLVVPDAQLVNTPVKDPIVPGEQVVIITDSYDVDAHMDPRCITTNTRICALLIKKNINYVAMDRKGFTALHYAVHRGNYAVVKAIIADTTDRPASPIVLRSVMGSTPLLTSLKKVVKLATPLTFAKIKVRLEAKLSKIDVESGYMSDKMVEAIGSAFDAAVKQISSPETNLKGLHDDLGSLVSNDNVATPGAVRTQLDKYKDFIKDLGRFEGVDLLNVVQDRMTIPIASNVTSIHRNMFTILQNVLKRVFFEGVDPLFPVYVSELLTKQLAKDDPTLVVDSATVSNIFKSYFADKRVPTVRDLATPAAGPGTTTTISSDGDVLVAALLTMRTDPMHTEVFSVSDQFLRMHDKLKQMNLHPQYTDIIRRHLIAIMPHIEAVVRKIAYETTVMVDTCLRYRILLYNHLKCLQAMVEAA